VHTSLWTGRVLEAIYAAANDHNTSLANWNGRVLAAIYAAHAPTALCIPARGNAPEKATVRWMRGAIVWQKL